MVFSSTIFLFLFLPSVLGIYYLPIVRNNRKISNVFLLLASLFFYAWGEPGYVFLMILSIIVTYFLGIGIDKFANIKMLLLIGGVLYHISLLFLYKYYTFFTQEVSKAFNKEWDVIEIVLPIGISFFTFQMLSYLIDVYCNNASVQKNIFSLAFYVAFFPQLVAGPIVRYQTIEYEIDNRKENKEDFQCGIRRFLLGLGKKALIADYLAIIADNVFSVASIDNIGLITAWIGAVAYMLEIYFDFSGYSDMAIGLGLCFGFHFKENFNRPYLADSINEFWKRWHISLTDWFRDYVYIPLGGNRVNRYRRVLNIIIVWVLTGIWHGANWTFILWGGIYCTLQLLEKYIIKVQKWPKYVRHIYTLGIVCVCWVIFRADSVQMAFEYIACMFGSNGLMDDVSGYYFNNGIVAIIVGTVLCLPFEKIDAIFQNNEKLQYVKEISVYIGLTLILVLAAGMSISGGYSPFIYFNF